jgi:neutral ceramidase
MKMRSILHGVGAAALLVSAAVCQTQMADLRAGAAKVDITPPKEMFPLKASQTYGSAHDPLYVRALVVDNGAARVATN